MTGRGGGGGVTGREGGGGGCQEGDRAAVESQIERRVNRGDETGGEREGEARCGGHVLGACSSQCLLQVSYMAGLHYSLPDCNMILECFLSSAIMTRFLAPRTKGMLVSHTEYTCMYLCMYVRMHTYLSQLLYM